MTQNNTIIANWKMNGDSKSIKSWKEELNKLLQNIKTNKTTIVACLPFTYLANNKHSTYKLGAQDCHYKENGPFTGDISATQLKDLSVKYAIIGHSERRLNHNENNNIVKLKAQTCINNKIIPIICVGEDIKTRHAGQEIRFVCEQLRQSIPENFSKIIVAYEPIWAIGSGETPEPSDVQSMHKALRSIVSEDIPIIYGGSINSQNANQFLQQNDINGVLVGGACQDPNEFTKIIKSAHNN